MDSFETLLEFYRRPGSLDSQGRFSLDPEGAARQARFALPSPQFSVLLLLRAAVQAGAHRVEVATGIRKLRLEHDGRPWEEPPDPGPRSLLGLGVTACRAAGWRVVVGESSVEVKKPWEGFRAFFQGQAGEAELLRRHALYGSVPVNLNGRSVTRPVFGCRPNPTSVTSTASYLGVELSMRSESAGEGSFPPGYHLFERYLLAPGWGTQTLAAPARRFTKMFIPEEGETREAPVSFAHTQSLVHQRKTAPAGLFEIGSTPMARDDETLPCWAMLAIGHRLEGPGRLLLVKDGVVLEMKEADLGVAGALAVIAAPRLEEDAGRFGVVENQAYQELLDELQRNFLEMSDDLRERLPVLENFELEEWVRSRLPDP